MKRSVSGVVAAVMLAALGTALLVAYVQSARNEALAAEKLVAVLVVRTPIPKGEAVVLGKNVAVEHVPAKVRAEGAVDRVDALKNLVPAVDLVPGEQVVRSRFTTKESIRRNVTVPPDKLEVTLSLEPERALGGTVRPGDTVGVVLSEKPFGDAGNDGNTTPYVSRMVLHKVLVTRVAMGQAPATPPDDKAAAKKQADKKAAPDVAPSGAVLVTLALDVHAVERVVFTAEYGSVWLAAEPSTAAEAGSKATTFGEIFQ